MADHSASPSPSTVPPLTSGFVPNLKFDIVAGFLVFLIAMPLCLGIAKAGFYPPIAGIWTAVIGGILTTFISNSQMTIKGPAAGLIVVVAGSVMSLGMQAVPDLPEADKSEIVAKAGSGEEGKKAVAKELLARQVKAGYPLALGCAIVAGVFQILIGLFKLGTLGELVPLSPIHGMLAAIGITIMIKLLFPTLGMPNAMSQGTPVEVFVRLPDALGQINWTIAKVGLASMAILIAFPYLKAAVPALKPVPAQVVVLATAIPLGMALGLGGDYLVSVPNILANPAKELGEAIHLPKDLAAMGVDPKFTMGADFSAVGTEAGIVAVLMFCLITSIESLLSSQAVDMIDPWRRKTDQNRDLLATGIANTLCAAVGASPMISEIVRSKANIDNGARTKYADMFHGLFLLAFVLLLPVVINVIPLAALGAMLVLVGFRLASPKEFVHTWKIGPEQLVVFVVTIVVTLSTDLLKGVASGIVLKALINLFNGAPMGSFFRTNIEMAQTGDDKVAVLKVRRAAVFANWLGLKSAILKAADGRDEVVVDLSDTRLVDHSTMEKLHQLGDEIKGKGKRLTLIGLEKHRPLSNHPLAARKGSGNRDGVAGTI